MFAGSVLARQLERAPSQYAGHRVTRGQVGEFVVIESNGSATIGRITEIQLPDRDRLSVGPERNEGDEAANPIGIIRLLGSVDLNSSRSSRGIGEAPRVGDYVYLSHPDFVRYAIVSTEGAPAIPTVCLEMMRVNFLAFLGGRRTVGAVEVVGDAAVAAAHHRGPLSLEPVEGRAVPAVPLLVLLISVPRLVPVLAEPVRPAALIADHDLPTHVDMPRFRHEQVAFAKLPPVRVLPVRDTATPSLLPPRTGMRAAW